jgi:hypothetical protein
MASYMSKFGIKIEATGADVVTKQIDDVANAADGAEKSTGKLSDTQTRLKGAFQSVTAPAKMMIGAATALAAAYTATVGAAVLLTKSHAEQAKELKSLAQAAGITAEEMQRLQFATAGLGFDAKGLSDVYKDMNDRIGDAGIGSGALMDFFEKIAPKVGVTYEQFKKLNSADALQLYVSSLEKAGASQADMTFYMEALSSESTKLLPLLQNNGAEMNRMKERAQSLGIVLSEVEISKLAAGTKAFTETGKIFGSVLDRISMNLAPIINAIAEKFSNAAIEAGGWEKVVNDSMRRAAVSVGYFADGLAFVGNVWDSIKLAVVGAELLVLKVFQGWSMISDLLWTGIATGVEWVVGKFNWFAEGINTLAPKMFLPIAKFADWVFDGIAEKINWVFEQINKLPDRIMAPIELIPVGENSFVDQLEALAGVGMAIVPTIDMEPIAKGTSVVTDNITRLIAVASDQAAGYIEQISAPLPSDRIIGFFDEVIAAADEAAELDIARKQDEKDRAAEHAAYLTQLEKDKAAEIAAIKLADDTEKLVSLQNSKTWNDSREKRAAKEKQMAADKLAFDADMNELQKAAWVRHWQIMSANEAAATAKANAEKLANEQMVADQKATIMSGAAAVASHLMESGSKKEFEAGKAASIGMALINTYQGATKAYGQGGILGFAAAASVIAAGMIQVNKIKNTQFGGKGGSATAPAAPPAAAQASGGGGQMQQVSVNITGGQFGAGAGDDVIDKLKDFFSRDGVLFDGASTQGQVVANG